MPLQKLQFRPGVNREGTTLSNEGGWFESDKIRFRSGYPEKIGGWVLDTGTDYSTLKPSTGAYFGICRAMWNWLNLTGYNLLADRKSTRLNSSHTDISRMPSSA